MSPKKRYILPLFIPFLGCGQRCIYCDQGAITGVASDRDILASVREQLDLWRGRRKSWDEAAFYGGTFASLPPELRKALYALVNPLPVRPSTCPDSISAEFLEEIPVYNIKTVELGVQSLSDEVLNLNLRPYTADAVIKVFAVLKPLTQTTAQFMTGMHGEDRQGFLNTCERAGALGADFARIYPTQVFKGTELGRLFRGGLYQPPDGAETLLRAAWLWINLEAAGTRVIRVGLPRGDGSRVIAGYRHAAMGELVKTLISCFFAETTGKVPVNFTGYKGFLRRRFDLPRAEGLVTMADMAGCIVKSTDGAGWFKENIKYAEELAEL